MHRESCMSPTTMPEAGFRTIGGVRIRYADSGGSREPTVLLTSPWPESVYAFAPMWEQLSAHARLFAVDLPGFGASERREDLLSPRAMGQFLAQLIAETDLGAPHIVAPDVGTAATLFAAATHPQRIASATVALAERPSRSSSVSRWPPGYSTPTGTGFDFAVFLISRRCARVNFGGRPPLYFGYSELNPSALKLRITSRIRSSLVKATFAIAGTSMPCAYSSTICARRHVTTDPDPRRTHQPPTLVIIDLAHPQAFCHQPKSARSPPARTAPREGANVTCYGTSEP
jgi:pimeloyl-ACP methyl ester carboxylesterase